MKANKIVLIFSVLMLTLSFSSCRKDVALPSQEFQKIFGEWEWVNTTGGFAGGITTPATEGYTKSIEFSEKGICRSFENCKKKDKSKYSFSQEKSIMNEEMAPCIEFEKSCMCHKNNNSKMLIQFNGDDTLYLSDNFYDGFCSMYVRK